MITLTNCQLAATEKFKRFINTPSKKEFILSAGAGFGKSFLIKYLVDEINKANDANELLKVPKVINNIAFLAPTHKAAGVLSEFTGEPVITIHAAFSLMRIFDRETGEQKFVRNPKKSVLFGKNTLLFLEESSMISTELLTMMKKNMPPGCRIVWIGDSLQLPPVNEVASPVFQNDIDTAELNTPIRFDNPELEDLTLECRKAVKEKRLPKLKPSAHVEIVGLDDFKKEILHQNHLGTDCKVIAWTNKVVNAYGKMIHKELYGSKIYNVGQKIVVNKRFTSQNGAVVFQTQKELTITEEPTAITRDIDGNPVEMYEITTDIGTFTVPIVKLHVTNALKDLKENKEWHAYYRLLDTIGNINNNYSITVHQSQGSTYNTVFVDLHNIMRNSNFDEMIRLLYVALSRASHRVVIYGR